MRHTHAHKIITIGTIRRGPGAIVLGQMVLELQKTWITAVICIHLGNAHMSYIQTNETIVYVCVGGCGYVCALPCSKTAFLEDLLVVAEAASGLFHLGAAKYLQQTQRCHSNNSMI